jgi:DNA-binding transcriptional LysR family regulator
MLAERVAGPLLEALDGIQKTLESVQHFDPRTSERRFRIYMSDVGQLILIPRLLRELEGTAPNLSVAVVDAPTRLARELMIDGGIDIAVGTFGDYDAGFHRQRLFTKGYMVIGRPDHPAFQGGLTLDKFLRARHAVYTPPAGSHDDFEEVLAGVCRAHGARRRVVVELAHGLGIAEVITAGDLLACVPKRLANTLVATGAVTSAEVPFASPQVEVSQFWHERMHSDEGHRWFRNLVYRTYSVM